MTELNITDLKARADSMGLKYHHRAGAEKILGIINAHLVEHPEVPVVADKVVAASVPVADVRTATLKDGSVVDVSHLDDSVDLDAEPLSAAEYTAKLGIVSRRNVGRLRRVRIQCMNPAKREWPGEFLSVGSSKLGTFKKFIPFNGEPYHVPQIIYNLLKERQCTIFHTVKDPSGRGGPDIRKGKLINEFAVEDLTPLTQEELAELGTLQALANNGL